MKVKIVPRTLKGFRDFLPEEARRRQYTIDIIRRTFERWGFEPLETPALEYLEVFSGNIGEDEKLFYKFEDEGGRKIALRYDQTVPACRVIAQYPEEIKLPFKRYQIQNVWRTEKPQKGRFREFLQCDADIFGATNPEADGEVVALSIDVFKQLGFEKPVALINDRALYKDVPYKAIVAIDKLKKNGEKGVVRELVGKGYSEKEAEELLSKVKSSKANDNLKTIFSYLDDYEFKENYQFSPTLARSFSYSTGVIWEIVVEGYGGGSVAGCERFDSLVERFSKREVGAVGFAIGFDRTIEAMEEKRLFPDFENKNKLLVCVWDKSGLKDSLRVAKRLRENGIVAETYTNPEDKIEKQLKYASRKEYGYTVLIGPDEKKKGVVSLKDMKSRKQEEVTIEKVIQSIKE